MMAEQQVLHQLAALTEHVIALESLLIEATGRRPPDRSIVPWREAARVLGCEGKNPAEAARKRIRREIAKVDGFPLRVFRNGVMRQDFEKWLTDQARTGDGAKIHDALRGGRRGGGAR